MTPNGIVRVHRDRSSSLYTSYTALYAFTVWIDDIRVDRLRSGREAVIMVPPGTHKVQLRWAPLWSSLGAKNSETIFFLAESGRAVHFNCTNVLEPFHDKIVLRLLGDPPVPVRILGVTDTTRVGEPLGEDVREMNNRDSPAPVTRSFKVSHTWTQTLTLGENHRWTRHNDGSVNLPWISAKASIEAELQRTLSVAIGSTHQFEEEVSVPVPEHTAVRIVLTWKRIWQRGNAHVLFPDGSVHIVPYQVVVSETFDQKIQDATSHSDG